MAHPILAAVLSFFIPGLGQAYAGDIKKGAIFLVIFIVLMIIQWFTVGIVHNIILIIDLIYSIYAAYDAYQLAK